MFEFWNHGYDHSRVIEGDQTIFEFRNSTLEGQRTTLSRSQELAREKLGFEMVTFGAPYNQSDPNTSAALEEFDEIKYWFYPPSGTVTAKTILPRIKELNIEYPVHMPSFYHFWNSYYFYSYESNITIQGHPNSWDEMRLGEFEKIVDYLIRLGSPIVKPSSLI